MSVSRRVVYQREFRVTPVWMWVLQRLSGVALGPLVLFHIWAPGGRNAFLNAILLALVVAHGYSGLRRIVNMTQWAATVMGGALAWAAIVAALGILILLGTA